MKIHNRYRRAKKFKLGEDGEVLDEFSGHRKAHIRTDWDYWDYRRSRGLSVMANAQRRLFAARVGKPWDNVYSEFVGRMKQEKARVAFVLRDRVDWSIEFHVKRHEDGRVGTLGYYRGFTELRSGEMYVDPDTGTLCRMPARKPERYKGPRREYNWRTGTYADVKEVVSKQVGNVKYYLAEKEHKRRVAPGKFEYETQYIWMKSVPYTYTWTERVGDSVLGYTNVVRTETRRNVYQASKKAIRKNKLNEIIPEGVDRG